MSVTLLCPNLRCRAVLQVPDGVRGKNVRCGHCGTVFSVPLKTEPVRRASTSQEPSAQNSESASEND